MSATALSSALRGRAGAFKRAAGAGVRRCERDQQPILRDIFVAGPGRGLLRGVQQAHQFRRDLRLPGAAALDLGLLGDLGLDRGLRRLRIAAGILDQPRGGAFSSSSNALSRCSGVIR